ncbi:MAG TPA: CopG family transcriptional regulator [Bryobacteraceae bacterium]|jgi:hypothetical protein
MRTTLTLDDDVAVLLERIRKQREVSLKDVINTALRHGLAEMQATPKPRTPFHTWPLPLGRCRLPNLDNIAEALAIAEGEDYK